MKADIKQWSMNEPLLNEIALAVESHFGFEFTITSPFRPGNKGVHGQMPCRGMDLRCYDKKVGKLIEKWVNSQWTYDPQRTKLNVCLYHKRHLHLQVHRNTK